MSVASCGWKYLATVLFIMAMRIAFAADIYCLYAVNALKG